MLPVKRNFDREAGVALVAEIADHAAAADGRRSLELNLPPDASDVAMQIRGLSLKAGLRESGK